MSCSKKKIFLALATLLSKTILFTTIQFQTEAIPNPNPNPNPFSFIGNFEGSKKGQTIHGLHKLKAYLAHFGYLDKDKSLSHDHKNNQVFDEPLESAIKTYQLNFRLNVTGYLDTNTVNQMMKPRCGVPDIINGTNRMRMHAHSLEQQQRDVDSTYGIVVVSNYSFMGTKWPKSMSVLTYKFTHSKLDPQGIDPRTIWSKSVSEWGHYVKFRFQEVSPQSYSNIEARFYSGDHGDRLPFDGPGGVLAHSFEPTIGQSHYDADEFWNGRPGWYKVDLQTVMTHEMGHILGLGHSSDPNAVMWPTVGTREIKTKLTQDDISGIRALYFF